MAVHPQPKTHKITFTETKHLDFGNTKDRGCRDNMLKVHYKQLFRISRAMVVGSGLTGATDCALDCQSEH